MELTGVQVGLDMASALAIIGSAATWYYNQQQEKKKEKEEEREKEFEKSMILVSKHFKKINSSTVELINFKNSEKLINMQKLGMNPNMILNNEEREYLEQLKNEYLSILDSHCLDLDELIFDVLLSSKQEVKEETFELLSSIVKKIKANRYTLEVVVFLSITLLEQIMIKTSKKELINKYILITYGLTIDDINKNLKELEQKGMIK